jgi:hypothetical protein
LAGLLLLLFPAQAQVFTDHFTNAPLQLGLTFTVSTNNRAASAEAGEPAHLGGSARRSLWAAWRPALGGHARISVAASSPGLRVGVYTGDALTNLSLVTGLSRGTTNELFFVAQPETTYRLLVDAVPNTPGTTFTFAASLARIILEEPDPQIRLRAPTNLTLRVAPAPGDSLESVELFARDQRLALLLAPPFAQSVALDQPGPVRIRAVATNAAGVRLEAHELEVVVRPANDDIEDAIEIPSNVLRGKLRGDALWASAGLGDRTVIPPLQSLWWRWSPRFAGWAELSLPEPSPAQSVWLRQGPTVTNLTPAISPMDSTGSKQTRVFVSPDPAQTLWLNLAGRPSGGAAPVELHFELLTLEFDPPPTGGLPTGPIALRWKLADTNLVLERLELLVDGVPALAADLASREFVWLPDKGGALKLSLRGRDGEGNEHFSAATQIFLPSLNDNFATPDVLPPDLTRHSWTNRDGLLTREELEPPHGEGIFNPIASAWWSWTPTRSGVAQWQVHAPDLHLAIMAVYLGDSFTNLTVVGRNSGPRRFADRVIFPVEAGRTYRLVLDGASQTGQRVAEATLSHHPAGLDGMLAAGDLALGLTNRLRVVTRTPGITPASAKFFLDDVLLGEVAGPLPVLEWLGTGRGPHSLSALVTTDTGESFTTPSYPVYVAPVNDLRRNALSLPETVTWSYEGDHGQATWEFNETEGWGEGGSVWLRWQAPATRGYAFRVTGGPDTRFYVFGGDDFGASWLVNRLPTGGGEGVVDLHGEYATYFQIAGPWTNGLPSPFRIERLTTPPNDDFAQAVVLTGPTVEFAATNQFSTTEDQELSGLRGSLWWRWTAPATGDVTIQADDSDCSVGVAMFRGEEWSQLRKLGETMPLVTFQPDGTKNSGLSTTFRVFAGQTYHLALGPDWQGGPLNGVIRARLGLQPLPDLPPNDEPDQPTVLTGPLVSVTTHNRQTLGDEWVGAIPLQHTVWFEWTAPSTGVLRASVASSEFQPMLFLGRGRYPSFQNLNFQNTGFWEPIFAEVTAGETYTMVIGAGRFGASEGEFRLELEMIDLPPRPANDRFAERLPVGTNRVVQVVDLAAATRESDDPDFVTTQPNGSLWWELLAPTAGHFVVNTTPWVEFLAYRGNVLAQLVPVEPQVREHPAVIEVVANEPVQLLLYGPRFVSTTNELRIYFVPAGVPNDAFANSQRLEGTNLVADGFLLGATREPGEPNHAFPASSDPLSGESAWWSWAAPFTGRATLRFGFGDLHWVGVYRGPEVGRLTRVPGYRNSGRHVFTAEAGQIYHFGVERLNGASGLVDLKLALEPFTETVSDHFEQAIRLTPAQPESRQSITDASRELGEPVHHPGLWGKTLWWRYVMPQNADMSVTVGEVTLSDVAVAVYSGTSVRSLIQQARGTGYLRFPAVGGREYYIVAEVPADAVGDVEIRVNARANPGGLVSVAGNLVRNPSFEELEDALPGKDWAIEPGYGGYVGASAPGAADGANFIQIGGAATVRQTVPTVAQRVYRLRFAVLGASGTGLATVRALMDGVLVGQASFPTAFSEDFWHWLEFVVTAPADHCLLSLETAGEAVSLDAISLVWLNEPPRLITVPQAAFAYVGGAASFVAGASGSEPLAYRWFHDGQPIPDANRHVLVLDPVTADAAGDYHVEVGNGYGMAASSRVKLQVQSVASPQIVLQPQGEAVVFGQFLSLSVSAVGPSPLTYRWLKDGVALPGATNRSLTLTNVSPTDLGEYRVIVGSYAETTESLPALVTAAPEAAPEAELAFQFAPFSPIPEAQLDAYVFDLDGVTRLRGSQFVAQLYVGPDLESLRPVGAPRRFMDGFQEGRWQFGLVNLPNVQMGQPFVAQVRAWDSSKAASYEEARALGMRFGRSKPLALTTSNPPLPSELLLTGLESFSLQLGLPDFTVGRVEAQLEPGGGQLKFRLTGAKGFRYLLERRFEGGNWRPVNVFENFPGELSFTVPLAEGSAAFFRARILD